MRCVQSSVNLSHTINPSSIVWISNKINTIIIIINTIIIIIIVKFYFSATPGLCGLAACTVADKVVSVACRVVIKAACILGNIKK